MGSSLSSTAAATEGPADDLDPPQPVQTTRTHLMSLSHAHNKFAVHLYQEYAKDGRRAGNLVIAPISVSLSLGMLYVGAKGRTIDELHKAMYLNLVQDEHLLPAFAAMHWDILRSSFPKGCTFETAIRLFAQAELTTTPQYEDLCIHYEISRVKQADFKNRPDLARKEINQWADDRTHSKIKDVIPMGIIDRDTKILVMCAVYLKPLWLHPFDKKKTNDMPFYLQMKETLNVRMMNNERIFRQCYISKLDCDVLEVPFANKYIHMLILLPRKQDGVQKMEGKFTLKHLDQIQDRLCEELVDVYVPKFRYQLGLTVGDILQKLNVKTMFTPTKADFSNINGSRDLYVSRIFHHVSMEIDEGGPPDAKPVANSNNSGAGTSSTSTANGEGVNSEEKQKKTFRADHPFLFVVKDDRTGAILFVGRLVRPLLAS